MAHFPASPSMSRLAGSSETESVQGDRVQKQDWKQSLEKKFCAPPARPRSCSRRRRQQGPRGPQRSKGRRTLTKRAIPKVEVPYVVTGHSETPVLSTRRRRGAKPLAAAAAAF